LYYHYRTTPHTADSHDHTHPHLRTHPLGYRKENHRSTHHRRPLLSDTTILVLWHRLGDVRKIRKKLDDCGSDLEDVQREK